MPEVALNSSCRGNDDTQNFSGLVLDLESPQSLQTKSAPSCHRSFSRSCDCGASDQVHKTISYMGTIRSRMNLEETDLLHCKTYERKGCSKLQLPFWLLVAVSIIISFLFACTGWFALSEEKNVSLLSQAEEQFEDAVKAPEALSRSLLQNLTELHFSRSMRSVGDFLRTYVVEYTDRAVDGLWTHMLTEYRFGHAITPDSVNGRQRLSSAMWSEICSRNQQRLDIINRADALTVISKSGSIITVSSDRPGGDTNCSVLASSGPNKVQRWSQAPFTGDPEVPLGPVQSMSSADLEIYQAQLRLSKMNPRGNLSQIMSGLHRFDDHGGSYFISWTSPIAYCGNYSCMEGVIAASVKLSSIQLWCNSAWMNLKALLASSPNDFTINQEDSSIFVVHQQGLMPQQSGLLIASSAGRPSSELPLQLAAESDEKIVRLAARATRKNFGSWNATNLQVERAAFTFCADDDYSEIEQITTSESDDKHANHLHGKCSQVATLSVGLDAETRWLIVLVLPLGAFDNVVRQSEQQVDKVVTKATGNLRHAFEDLRTFNMAMFIAMVAISIILGIGLSACMSYDLHHLTRLMRHLGSFDFSTELPEFKALYSGRRSCIRDVSELQHAFCRLSQTVKVFARFVPEAVVRNIVRGDSKSIGLHVCRREVTVMFSDIRGFTSIAETLSEEDLLYVLTRYLTEITNIIESSGGVVAEILGDGVLAYWNTPDEVYDHASKACQAALAQQHSLHAMNQEFASFGLPQLSIRIGLHTSRVLTGNFGGVKRMKFGCMGDGVNLASRLEGLCKRYDVGILCSGCTRAKLSKSLGFLCRRLDLVQVKGRQEATSIYEVVSCNSFEGGDEAEMADLRSRIADYEAALSSFKSANFQDAETKLEALLEMTPLDTAASLLLGRVKAEMNNETLSDERRAAWTGVLVMLDK
eukprot:TRINITY_DN10871_c0_g1_i1.p1 TRINITY_DN10871_c0_g1~~TRINITY_DN10871_c0_g1_i1.p1  ORF type:complete len:926 (-),score=98.97 TRINITY_DN10871_c0_g1_i1:421-3198(-)